MKRYQFKKHITGWNSVIILLSIIGFIICVAVLFPQVRQMIMNFAEQIVNKKASTYHIWTQALLSYAIGGICFILFIDYLTLTDSGRTHSRKVTGALKECLSEIDFRSFVKPILLIFGVYLLGIFTIIRANFSYMDDIGRTVTGYRGWYAGSRYVSEFLSVFVHGNTAVTDISPLPQLLAILVLSVSSVFLVYVIADRKLTVIRLLASLPLGLSPYFLECLSYKYDAPYMALSILASIVPFLFINRKKAFLFSSVVSLLIMWMTYQSASGVYMLIVVILCFKDWNKNRKSVKEILSFFGMAALSFCLAVLLFKIFLMRNEPIALHSASQILSGIFKNLIDYIMIINSDFGIVWKVGIALVVLFFITRSVYQSGRKRLLSFVASVLVAGLSFFLSYGILYMVDAPMLLPRFLSGFGIFLAVLCIYVVSDYIKIATLTVLALNWCLFTFAFSYGNALADQSRYAEFRSAILLNDLSALFPERNREEMSFQFKNSIGSTPSIKNIAKHYPVIERLTGPKQFAEGNCWDIYYFLEYFNFSKYRKVNYPTIVSSEDYVIDFDTLNLPVVLDSYYHTIRSDGNRTLIIFKH